jgi:hypothetical protein
MANDFHMGANMPEDVSLGVFRYGDDYVYGA